MPRTFMRSALAILLILCGSAAFAHDMWINRGAFKNPAGEWCCGAEDCGVVSPKAVHATSGGYSVAGTVTYGQAITGNVARRSNHAGPCQRGHPLQPGAPVAGRCLLALQAA